MTLDKSPKDSFTITSQMWTQRIVRYAIFTIIFYFILQLFLPILKFKIVIDWWKQGSVDDKGNPLKGSENFNIYSLAYWQYFSLYYHINVLLSSSLTALSDADVLFITSFIYGQAKGIIQGGYFTPKMLCNTCVPDDFDMTKVFDKDGNGSWKAYMQSAWGVSWDGTNYNVDNDKWNAADNFLFQNFAIPANSPAVYGYITNRATAPDGTPIEPKALDAFFGMTTGISSGGILGYLQGHKGETYSYDSLSRELWANVSNPKSGDVPKNGCGSANSILSIISSGFGLGITGAFIGGPVGLLVGILGGLAGGLSTASQNGCF